MLGPPQTYRIVTLQTFGYLDRVVQLPFPHHMRIIIIQGPMFPFLPNNNNN